MERITAKHKMKILLDTEAEKCYAVTKTDRSEHSGAILKYLLYFGVNQMAGSKEPENMKPEGMKPEDKESAGSKPQDGTGFPDEEKKPESIEDRQREIFNLELKQAQRQRKGLAIRFIIVLISMVGSLFAVFAVMEYIGLDFQSNMLLSIVLFIVFSAILGSVFVLYTSFFFDQNENAIRQKMTDFEFDCLQNKMDIFEDSTKMSYRHLNQYYSQIRDQARRGFWVCIGVSVCGVLLIFFGIAFMFSNRVAPSYVTCASGAITEFIASIFFYLYNKTVSSMSNYHDKLVLSHNVSIALKVAESLPDDEKVNAKKEIISELLKDLNVHLLKGKDEASA